MVFMHLDLKIWLDDNERHIENYIIVGCEVDICVSHFATTLKTYFNQKNLNRRIIVPVDSVETFDFGTHSWRFNESYLSMGNAIKWY